MIQAGRIYFITIVSRLVYLRITLGQLKVAETWMTEILIIMNKHLKCMALHSSCFKLEK